MEIPKFFIAMNNWAVWSGHSTKSCSIHSEALGGGSLSSVSRGGDTHTLQHGGDLGALFPSSAAVAPSSGYISSFLSAQYNTPVTTVRGATCLHLLGHTTNSRSLALIELMFLFRGSCLVSLSLRFTLATSLSSYNLYIRLARGDQLLVSSLSYTCYGKVTTAPEESEREIKKGSKEKSLTSIGAAEYSGMMLPCCVGWGIGDSLAAWFLGWLMLRKISYSIP